METPHGFTVTPKHAAQWVPLGAFVTADVDRAEPHRAMADGIVFSLDRLGGVRIVLTLTDEAWRDLGRIVDHRAYDRLAPVADGK